MDDTEQKDGGGRSPRTIKSVRKAFGLLETLKARNGATVTELADATELSKGTVHTYLSTLTALGFVEKAEEEYDLGRAFIPLTEYVRNRSVLYRAGNLQTDKLAFECEEYVHLMSEFDGLEIALHESRGRNAIGTEYYRRMREEPQKLHYSSAGKSMLAYMTDERVREIIDTHGLDRRTPKTITDVAELFDRLDAIRDRGYAVNDEEEMEGMRAVGAPIRNEAGEVLGAVSVSGPKSRLNGELFADVLPEQVMQTANIVELNIRTEQYER